MRIAIRLIVYAPSKTREPPSVDMGKIIMMWPSKLYLECSLDKELYHHGESLNVNINIKVKEFINDEPYLLNKKLKSHLIIQGRKL